MKTLISILFVLLVVGCGTLTPEEQPVNTDGNKSTEGKLVRKLTAEEEKVVGEYELKLDGDSYKWVFLDNGVLEWYKNGKKIEVEYKWKIVGKEIHLDSPFGYKSVYRINKDRSITYIAGIHKGGKRSALPKKSQVSYKKTK